MKKTSSKKPVAITLLTALILIVVLTTRFFFGFYHLGKESYVDERLWTYGKEKRLEKYWNNIKEFDWGHTKPSDKPGITLAIISIPSLFFVTPSDFKEPITDKESFVQMFKIMRLPILIVSTLLILLFYFIIRKSFNQKIALLSAILIGLSPILLGISRIINPDALSWIFIPASFLSFLAYQQKPSRQLRNLTGILLGLSLLTKYIANILFPVFIALIFWKVLWDEKPSSELKKCSKYLKQNFSDLLKITLLALLTFTILYPGVWVKPSRLLIGTLWSQAFLPVWKPFVGLIFFLVLDCYFNNCKLFALFTKKISFLKKIITFILPTTFLFIVLIVLYYTYTPQHSLPFEKILYSPKTMLLRGKATFGQSLLTAFYVPLFALNPLALLGVLFALLVQILSSLKNKTLSKLSSKFTYNFWAILFFIFVFYSASLFSKVIPTLRYQIALLPLWFILATLGWYYFWQLFSQKLPSFKNTIFYLLILIFLILQINTLRQIKPFYFSYNSSLLPQNHLINPKDMGDGSYEAAQYLNSLPNAKNLNIWSDRRGVCVFFVGEKCNRSIKRRDFLKHGPNYDFFAVSKARRQKMLFLWEVYGGRTDKFPLALEKIYDDPNPDFVVHPGQRQDNYVKIVSGEKYKIDHLLPDQQK
jgi:hypothetical protein